VNGQTLLKRMIATVGLLLMFPIGLQLVQGTLTPADAAVRAAAVFAAVWIGRSLAALAPGGPTVLLPAEPVDANEAS
jgi:hypothetical protein